MLMVFRVDICFSGMDHVNFYGWWGKETHPDEIKPLMESCGLKTLRLIGCEGIVAGHEEKVNELKGEAWDIWVELNYRLGREPTLYGAADHLL